MTLYPISYGTRMVTMAELRAVHEPKMHPEFARRLFPYFEFKEGLIGIGGGWRAAQPTKSGFAAEGQSFHQTQQWASGFAGYAAVDLVAVNDAGLLSRLFSLNGSAGNPDATLMSRALTVQKVHRAPTWAETEDAPEWGLHTFIKNPPEPWHMQPIEIRGWQTWVNAGRPDPVANIPLPIDLPPPPEEDDVSKPISVIKPEPGWKKEYDNDNGPATFVRYGSGVVQRAVANDETVAIAAEAAITTHNSIDWYNDLLRQSGSDLPRM